MNSHYGTFFADTAEIVIVSSDTEWELSFVARGVHSEEVPGVVAPPGEIRGDLPATPVAVFRHQHVKRS